VNNAVNDHTLRIYTLGTVNNGMSVRDNTSGSTHYGWYTQNRGAIDLQSETINSGGHIFWGTGTSSPADYIPGSATRVAVNSAYLHSSNLSSGDVDISLLDPARATTVNEASLLLANNTGMKFLNIWQVDNETGASLTLDMFSVRYDEGFSLVNSSAAHGTPVQGFYFWDGSADGSWIDLTLDTTVDGTNYIAQYSGSISIDDGDSGFFALASFVIPEPGTTSMMLCGLATLLSLRRLSSLTREGKE